MYKKKNELPPTNYDESETGNDVQQGGPWVAERRHTFLVKLVFGAETHSASYFQLSFESSKS
jgi:hypothetical protein